MKTKLSRVIILLGVLFLNNNTGAGTVSDVDGNSYDTVDIGTQVWLKQNLKVTKYQNGDLIGTTPWAQDISTEATPKYQWPVGGADSNLAAYGRVYTWFTASDTRNICPLGWHVPTDAEFATLVTYLGGKDSAGGKMKETGIGHWLGTSSSVTNSSGFTALPGGGREPYSMIGRDGVMWASSQIYGSYGPILRNYSGNTKAEILGAMDKKSGYCVRCIKGELNVGMQNRNINPSVKKGNGLSDIAVFTPVEILNMQGQLVQSISWQGSVATLTAGDLPKGLYLLKVKSAANISVHRFIRN